MLRLKEGDNSQALHLLTAKTQVERDFEANKWALVANAIVKKGGGDYPVEFLKRQWRDLEGKGGLAAALEAKGKGHGGLGDGGDGGDGGAGVGADEVEDIKAHYSSNGERVKVEDEEEAEEEGCAGVS
ncbi:MAG: hypothetical protein Q9217_002498 [Psora testacea]